MPVCCGVHAAVQTAAQMQAAHVANDGCGVKGLLWCRTRRVRHKRTHETQGSALQGKAKKQSQTQRRMKHTLHLLFAKFFLIWRLTDSWMFLESAVSPAILNNRKIRLSILQTVS